MTNLLLKRAADTSLGAGVLIKLRDDEGYLLEENTPEVGFPTDLVGKYRPVGGGAHKRDKSLFDTAVRELHEELGLSRDSLIDNLRLLGYIRDGRYKDCAMFELTAQPSMKLEPKTYQATNSKTETVKLVKVKSLEDPKYIGKKPVELRKAKKGEYGYVISKSELKSKARRFFDMLETTPLNGMSFFVDGTGGTVMINAGDWNEKEEIDAAEKVANKVFDEVFVEDESGRPQWAAFSIVTTHTDVAGDRDGKAGYTLRKIASAGPDMDRLVPYLWNAENAAKKGKSGNTWLPYDDRGHLAIGPGIRVDENRSYSDDEVNGMLRNSINDHWSRARKSYPGFDDLPPQDRNVLFDYTYMGVMAPKFHQLASSGQDPSGEITLKNERREKLLRELYNDTAPSNGLTVEIKELPPLQSNGIKIDTAKPPIGEDSAKPPLQEKQPSTTTPKKAEGIAKEANRSLNVLTGPAARAIYSGGGLAGVLDLIQHNPKSLNEYVEGWKDADLGRITNTALNFGLGAAGTALLNRAGSKALPEAMAVYSGAPLKDIYLNLQDPVKSLPDTLDRLTQPDLILPAAVLGAGGLGAYAMSRNNQTGYQPRVINLIKESPARPMMRIPLRSPYKGGLPVEIEVPMDQVNMSNAMVEGIARDVRRRVRSGIKARTMKRDPQTNDLITPEEFQNKYPELMSKESNLKGFAHLHGYHPAVLQLAVAMRGTDDEVIELAERLNEDRLMKRAYSEYSQPTQGKNVWGQAANMAGEITGINSMGRGAQNIYSGIFDSPGVSWAERAKRIGGGILQGLGGAAFAASMLVPGAGLARGGLMGAKALYGGIRGAGTAGKAIGAGLAGARASMLKGGIKEIGVYQKGKDAILAGVDEATQYASAARERAAIANEARNRVGSLGESLLRKKTLTSGSAHNLALRSNRRTLREAINSRKKPKTVPQEQQIRKIITDNADESVNQLKVLPVGERGVNPFYSAYRNAMDALKSSAGLGAKELKGSYSKILSGKPVGWSDHMRIGLYRNFGGVSNQTAYGRWANRSSFVPQAIGGAAGSGMTFAGTSMQASADADQLRRQTTGLSRYAQWLANQRALRDMNGRFNLSNYFDQPKPMAPQALSSTFYN